MEMGVSKDKRRVEWLDSLRAVAVLLVVLGHVAHIWSDGCMSYLARGIYLFHMPLFFMISGITYELFTSYQSTKCLRIVFIKRVINLIVPAAFFSVLMFILLGGKRDIFLIYNAAWFLWFLAFIIGSTVIEDALALKWKYISVMVWTVSIGVWILFGVLQLIFENAELELYSKLTRELSKLGGYFVCFKYGRTMIRTKENSMKCDFKFIVSLILFILIQIMCAWYQIHDNTALIKIVCGLLGSRVLVCMFYNFRQGLSKLEKLLSQHSVEVYLIHTNIIHEVMLVAALTLIEVNGIIENIMLGVIVLVLDIVIPMGIVVLEKYIPPLDFIFHPMKYVEKMRFYRRFMEQ